MGGSITKQSSGKVYFEVRIFCEPLGGRSWFFGEIPHEVVHLVFVFGDPS